MGDELSISVDVNGLLAWLLETPDAVRKEDLRATIKLAHRETWRRWADAPDGVNYGLRMRFSERAFTLLSLTPRTLKYQKRQRASLGRVLPWVSPVGGMGRSTHMYKLVTVEGTGWNPRTRGTTEVHSQANIPGARILNRLPGKNAKYREEFYDAYKNPADRDFLSNTLSNLTSDLVMGLLAKSYNSTKVA